MRTLLSALVFSLCGMGALLSQVPFDQEPILKTTEVYLTTTTIGNFTTDTLADIVVGTRATFLDSSYLEIFAQDENGSFNSHLKLKYPESRTGISSLITTDLNLDGRDDLLFAFDNTIGIYYQDAYDQFDSLVTIALNGRISSIQTGDFNNDSLIDIAAGFKSDNVFALLQQSTDGFITNTFSIPANTYREIEVGDLNNDGLEDILLVPMNYQDSVGLYIFYQTSTGISDFHNLISPGDVVDENCRFNASAIGDINGDGLLDVIASIGADGNSSALLIWPQLPNHQLKKNPVLRPTLENPQALEIKDINNDGYDDIVLLHGGWRSLSCHFGAHNLNQMISSEYQLPYASNYNPQAMSIADVNKDEISDVAIASFNRELILYLSDEEQVQQSQVESLADILNQAKEDAGKNSDNWISAHPNPATSNVVLTNRGVVDNIDRILVSDINNREMLSFGPISNIHFPIAMDLASWPSGTYFIKISTTDSKHQIKKFIIQR